MKRVIDCEEYSMGRISTERETGSGILPPQGIPRKTYETEMQDAHWSESHWGEHRRVLAGRTNRRFVLSEKEFEH